jgi:outer membrane immunogenic protein
MKFKYIITAILTMLSITAFSQEEEPRLYMGLGYDRAQFETSGFDVDVEAIRLNLGYSITPFFAIEIRGGFGVNDDTDAFSIPGAGTFVAQAEVDHYYGIYLRGELASEERLKPYGIIGYTEGRVELQALGFSVDEDEGDFSYGLGLEWLVNDSFSIEIEYLQLMDKNDFEIDTLGINVKGRF